MLHKKSQVSIFIIIAIIIVALVVGYFILKSRSSISGLGSDFRPVEEKFLSCIEEQAKAGVSILEETGGFIYLPNFEPGSDYMPSSSQLSFFGSAIPYWYYISENNLAKEQVPSKNEMEQQLEKYLEENLVCDFSEFEAKGYVLSLKLGNTDVKILDDKVEVIIDANLDMSLENKNARVSEHRNQFSTKLGTFYNKALEIYNTEKQTTFLESYGVDVLYSYAPVTDVVISCSPKIWKLRDVQEEIKQGLENNFIMLKSRGSYYDAGKTDKYFITPVSSENPVQFLYSSNWPTKIEVKNNGGLLIAEPVGNQPALGAMGFCYVPVHFVYDVIFPVLIQIYDNNEIFRFPVVVVIKGNKEKNPLPGTYFADSEDTLCQYKNTEIEVYTYDSNLEPVEADISFECLNQECNLGETKLESGEASLKAFAPQCVNGFITAQAEGYKEKKLQMSTNTETTANLILDRLYNLSVELNLDSKVFNDFALISFESEDYSASIVLPEQNSIKLSDGLYNIGVYTYRNSSLTLPASSSKKCVKVPRPGLLGMFGVTREECFDLNIPEQILTNIISGGGKSQEYLDETNLNLGKMKISVKSVPVPRSIQDLQTSYDSLENNPVEVNFE